LRTDTPTATLRGVFRRLLTLPIAAAIALTLSISACGGGSSDSDAVVGKGYELTLPDGWSRSSSTAGVDVHIVKGEGKDQKASLTIARTPDPPQGASLAVLTSTLRSRLLTSVPQLSPSDVSAPRPTKLAGTDALGLDIQASVQGRKAHILGLVTLHDGVEYTVTFAGPPGNADGQATDYRSILKSWKWAEA
jgi:hypothetical protein